MNEKEMILDLIKVYENTLDMVREITNHDIDSIKLLLHDCEGFNNDVHRLLMKRITFLENVKVLLSNHSYEAVRDLYKYTLHT